MPPRIIEIHVPEYDIEHVPDYVSIGQKVDRVLEREFPDGKYLLRAIGADDHPGLSVEGLIDIIISKGTDKYDPDRKAVCHEEFSGYDYDIHAGTMVIEGGRMVIPESYKYPTEFGDIIWHFFEHAPLDRGHSVRIDLLLVYDFDMLSKAAKICPRSDAVREDLANHIFRFDDRGKKHEALIAIVKILR